MSPVEKERTRGKIRENLEKLSCVATMLSWNAGDGWQPDADFFIGLALLIEDAKSGLEMEVKKLF